MSASHGAERKRTPEAGSPDRPAEDALVEELRAEFADHVASARERLECEGLPADDAQRRALEQFGDVAAIVRRCWWIRKGDEIMNRAIVITLLVVLLAGLATLGVAGWHAERSMGGRMDHLSEQLASLAETQQSLLKQQAQTLPVRIRGRLYLGEPSQPAANAKLWVYDFTSVTSGSNMNRLRLVETDAQGNFNSGPLPPGAYFIAAPLYDREGNPSEAGYGIQSRPLYLYQGNDAAEVELDVLASSEIRVALVQPIPDQIEGGEQSLEMQLELHFIRAGYGGLPWNPEFPPPWSPAWPLTGSISSGLGDQKPSNLPVELTVPEGKYSIWITMRGRNPRFGGYVDLAIGKLESVELAKGESVEVRVEFPSSAVEQLRTALESQRGTEEFRNPLKQGQLKLELVRSAGQQVGTSAARKLQGLRELPST